MKALILIVLVAGLGGCIQDQTDTGPSVQMSLSTEGGDSVSNSDSDPQLDLQGMTDLTVTIEVDTEGGSTDFDDSTYDVTQFSGTLSIPQTSFTEADFTSDGNEGSPTFTSNDPVMIPASAVGKSIAVTLNAQDSRGLKAYPISFSIMVIDSGNGN